jgi:hypothetical protein
VEEPMLDNDDSYIKRLAAEHKIYHDSLPDEQKKTINKYTLAAYKDMNNYLRGERKYEPERLLEITTYIRDLTIAINNAPPTTEPMIVYRGIESLYLPPPLQEKLANLKVGETVDLFKFGFTSTTFTRKVADDFILGTCCVFMLYLPAGVKGIYIGSESANSSEDEFILGPGPLFTTFSYPGESFPVKTMVDQGENETGGFNQVERYTYRMVCTDCNEIYHINKEYDKRLLCDEKKGCYKVSKIVK